MCDTKKFFGATSLKQLNFELIKEQGKARERVLDDESCAEYLSAYEDFLGLPKAKLKGLKVRVHACMEQFPHAYKYTPYTTRAVFEHNGRHWVFVPLSVDRRSVFQRAYGGHIECLVMPNDAKDAIIAQKLFY
jgi:hypothetical protein